MSYRSAPSRGQDSAYRANRISKLNLTRLVQEQSTFQGSLRDRLYGAIDSGTEEGDRSVRVARQRILRNLSFGNSYFTIPVVDLLGRLTQIGYFVALTTLTFFLLFYWWDWITWGTVIKLEVYLFPIINIVLDSWIFGFYFNWAYFRSSTTGEEVLDWELEVVNDLRREHYQIDIEADEYLIKW